MVKKSLISIFSIIFICLSCVVHAGKNKIPDNFLRDIDYRNPGAVVSLKSIDPNKELQSDASKLTPGPLRFAVANRVKISPDTHGEWVNKSAHVKLWQVHIRVDNATDLNLGFSDFNLPDGATLYFINKKFDFLGGPYTSKNNKVHHKFWSPIMPGSEITLLLYVPKKNIKKLKLRLGSVNAGYRDLYGTTGLPNLSKQGSCNIDTVCREANNWRDEIRSVARISIDGTGLCTATLLMDSDETYRPFLLTAHHCGITAAKASSVVAYWNYESSSCGAHSGGSLAQNQSGAVLRASKYDVDITLLELDDLPEPSFNVFYSGWNRTVNAAIGAVGIHHPNADEKAISFNHDVLRSGQSCIGTSTENTHWYLNWEQGTTEPGSSGSGIWNDRHQLVGTLSGGFASCDNLSGDDCYGRLTAAWGRNLSASEGLGHWLDPENTQAIFINGSDLPPALPEPRFISPAADQVFAAGSHVTVNWRRTSPVASYHVDYSEKCTPDIAFLDAAEVSGESWTSSRRNTRDDWNLDRHSYRGDFGWFAASPGFSLEQVLTLAVPESVPPHAILSVWHDYDLEQGFDGGLIELSTNGVHWIDSSPYHIQHNYNGTVGSNAAFTGNSHGYQETQMRLASFSGQSLFIRFRLLTDDSVSRNGWYIDHLSIFSDFEPQWMPVTVTAAGRNHFDWVVPQATSGESCLRIQGTAPGFRNTSTMISPPFRIQDISPELTITATVNKLPGVQPGAVLDVGKNATWKYFITNQGNVEIRDMELREKQKIPTVGAWEIICTIRSIPPGATRSCSNVVVTKEGGHKSILVARTRLATGKHYEKSINTFYTGTIKPLVYSLSVLVNGLRSEKPGASIAAGSQLSWVYTVTNTGNRPLNAIEIKGRKKSPQLGRWETLCHINYIPVNRSKSCSSTSVAVAGQYKALIISNAGSNHKSEQSALVFYKGEHSNVPQSSVFTLAVLANRLSTDRPGPVFNTGTLIDWSYAVHNPGRTDLRNIVINGRQKLPSTGALNELCRFKTIPAGGTKTCHRRKRAEKGPYKQLVTVEGQGFQATVSAFYRGR
ncbi:MAG: hypothetical protein V3V12_09735 [Gammaproteobacteria bacterium]